MSFSKAVHAVSHQILYVMIKEDYRLAITWGIHVFLCIKYFQVLSVDYFFFLKIVWMSCLQMLNTDPISWPKHILTLKACAQDLSVWYKLLLIFTEHLPGCQVQRNNIFKRVLVRKFNLLQSSETPKKHFYNASSCKWFLKKNILLY